MSDKILMILASIVVPCSWIWSLHWGANVMDKAEIRYREQWRQRGKYIEILHNCRMKRIFISKEYEGEELLKKMSDLDMEIQNLERLIGE